ncbi:hypothetical protein ACJ5NV_18755 [Loktanella agnita]
MQFVDVLNDDGSRRFLLRPFLTSSVRSVSRSKTQLFCMSASKYASKEKGESTELAVYDLVEGKELRRVSLPFQAYTVTHLPLNGILAIQFMDRILHFLDAETLNLLWTTAPLYVPELSKPKDQQEYAEVVSYSEIPSQPFPYPAPPGCAYVDGSVFEDVDGTVWGLIASSFGDKRTHEILGTSAGMISFDVQNREHAFHPIEFSPWGAKPLFGPSPDGRFAFRYSPQCDMGPLHDAPGDSDKMVWMIDHHHLDLWSLTDQSPVRRIHVSDIPVVRYVRNETPKETEEYLREVTSWTNQGKDQYRHPSQKPRNAESFKDVISAGFALNELREAQHKTKVFWESDSQAFWVVIRNSMRRIKVNGTKGPLLFPSRYLSNEDVDLLEARPGGTNIGLKETGVVARHPHTRSFRATENGGKFDFYNEVLEIPRTLAESDESTKILQDDMISITAVSPLDVTDVAHLLPGLIRVESWGQEDIDAGLERLAGSLRSDLLGFSSDGGISFVFQVGASFFDEKQFIAEVNKKGIQIVESTKTVIDAWCDALLALNLTFGGNSEGAGPLAYFLEFLSHADDSCSDQLRRYCVFRDGEHESYSRDRALKGYLDRLSFTRADLWQLGILYALLFGRDGRTMVLDGKVVSNWIHTGILESARSELKPKEFAHMIKSEFAYLERLPDTFAAFGSHPDAIKAAKQDLLGQLGWSLWDRRLSAGLSD